MDRFILLTIVVPYETVSVTYLKQILLHLIIALSSKHSSKLFDDPEADLGLFN